MLLQVIARTKLLGVPAIRHKSSTFADNLIAHASDKLFKIWDCQSSLAGMVLDTTSSNTGAQTEAWVASQNTISNGYFGSQAVTMWEKLSWATFGMF